VPTSATCSKFRDLGRDYGTTLEIGFRKVQATAKQMSPDLVLPGPFLSGMTCCLVTFRRASTLWCCDRT
jgi:hypothetical protein